MYLLINIPRIRFALSKHRDSKLVEVHTAITGEGLSALHLLVFSESSDCVSIKDVLAEAIDNQYACYAINELCNNTATYSFIVIKGYAYCLQGFS